MNNSRKALISVFALAVMSAPAAAGAHPKGLYDSRQQAEQRAQELGCQGTHQNNGKWMPCADEAAMHQHQRHD